MSGIYRATVASNIAFLKYWGKRDAALQWPANDSLSMTLSALRTETSAALIDAADHRFRFDGRVYSRSAPQFAKAFRQLDRLAACTGVSTALEIESCNFFPMGAGMASSASGLAALSVAALAALTAAPDWATLAARGFDRSRLADLSRLGSGSAGRSLFGGYVRWRAGENAEAQSIEPRFDAAHWALRDSVIVFSHNEKGLSSSDAHTQAWSSPLFGPRLAGLDERLEAIEAAIARRELKTLGPLLETEALDMHAVIMTAQPPYQYLNQIALDFLGALRSARQRGEIAAYFTIDAGPNIHVIHEESEHARLCAWLEAHWPSYLLLHDRVGSGPQLEFISH